MVHRRDEPEEVSPRGALALAVLFGLLTVLIWSAIYFGIFLPRG